MAPVIALIFDFDDTLAPDSTSSFLAHQGVDLRDFCLFGLLIGGLTRWFTTA